MMSKQFELHQPL